MEAKLTDPNLCKNFAERMEYMVVYVGGPAELARRLGTTAPALMRWRKGEAEPTLSNLVKLARAASVGVEWLATGRGRVHEIVVTPQPMTLEIDEATTLALEAGIAAEEPAGSESGPANGTAVQDGRTSPAQGIAVRQDFVESAARAVGNHYLEHKLDRNPDKEALLIAVLARQYELVGISEEETRRMLRLAA